jgi:hypothetical protein
MSVDNVMSSGIAHEHVCMHVSMYLCKHCSVIKPTTPSNTFLDLRARCAFCQDAMQILVHRFTYLLQYFYIDLLTYFNTFT